MKDPAVLFYTGDFISGTTCLTMEERGQYITLLCTQHQQGHLSEKQICLVLGIKNIEEVKDVLSKFQKDKEGLFFNKRMDEEIEKRKNYCDSKRKGAIKRWGLPQ